MTRRHVVKQGEGVETIAPAYGLFLDTVWNHPANAELRRLRGDPTVLMPGDVLVIPDKRDAPVRVATGAAHWFRRRGVPLHFRLQLFEDDEPRRALGYQLVVDGRELRGVTDDDGWLEAWLPVTARAGELILDDGACYPIRFGELDPVTSDSGARARLVNLGYLDGTSADPPALREAVMAFQRDCGLPDHGDLDDATRGRLRDQHGS